MKAVITAVLLPVGVIAWAWAAAYMWAWFVAPLGLPIITPLHAVGISLTGWMLYGVAYGFLPQEPEQPLRHLQAAIGTFLAAYAVHLVMSAGR